MIITDHKRTDATVYRIVMMYCIFSHVSSSTRHITNSVIYID